MKATLLAALSTGTITKSSLREHTVFLTSCSLKVDFTNLHVIIFLRVQIFSFIDDITLLPCSEKCVLWMPVSFDVLSLN